MTNNVIKTIAIVGGALLSVAIVNVIFRLIQVDDNSLLITMIALFASGTSVDFYTRLSKRYLSTIPPSEA